MENEATIVPATGSVPQIDYNKPLTLSNQVSIGLSDIVKWAKTVYQETETEIHESFNKNKEDYRDLQENVWAQIKIVKAELLEFIDTNGEIKNFLSFINSVSENTENTIIATAEVRTDCWHRGHLSIDTSQKDAGLMITFNAAKVKEVKAWSRKQSWHEDLKKNLLLLHSLRNNHSRSYLSEKDIEEIASMHIIKGTAQGKSLSTIITELRTTYATAIKKRIAADDLHSDLPWWI